MDFSHFIGIDIAKDTLDWAVYPQQGNLLLNTHSDNTLKGIKSALAQFKALSGWNPTQAVFCMEHTGIYTAHLLEVLYESKRPICLDRAAGAGFPADQAGRGNATG